MISKEDIRPISYVKTNASSLLSQVNETRRPVIITQNGNARAVLLDTESYESLNNAVNILKLVSMGEKDIRDGNLVSQSELFTSIGAGFSKK